MSQKRLARIGGFAMLGVFVLNLYIGLYDSNLFSYNLAHYYLNWIIAAVDVVSAAFLLVKSNSAFWIAISGIAWPIAYLLSLGGDVASSLCLGTPNDPNCWPTAYDAFKYLILGDASEGWLLWPYTIPLAIALLVVAIALSALSIRLILSKKKIVGQTIPSSPSKQEERDAKGPMQTT